MSKFGNDLEGWIEIRRGTLIGARDSEGTPDAGIAFTTMQDGWPTSDQAFCIATSIPLKSLIIYVFHKQGMW